ncbi:sporulation protein [Peribacillus sp. SCS-155]|uniref:sporulation protein n=1 Tax=Peribacillus sedimenti TaxID=3115297 RepID=UPI003906C742
MFKKILASLGKGAATVDLTFGNKCYRPGEDIHGEVILQGGDVDQKLNSLAVRLMLNVTSSRGQLSRAVTTIPLPIDRVVKAKERKAIPFHYTIPTDIPFTRSYVSYHFETLLDIEGGVDRTDVDRLVIEPSERIQSVFRSLERFGFREKPDSGKVDSYGQEFAFFPNQQFAGHINEVELRLAGQDSGIQVFMEVDIRNGYHEIEAKREFFIPNGVLQTESELDDMLLSVIQETANQPYAYSQPFSFRQHGHQGSGKGSMIPGMIGGLAVGILGSMALNELMDGFDAEGMMEDAMGEIEDVEEGFDSFFGGDDEEF